MPGVGKHLHLRIRKSAVQVGHELYGDEWARVSMKQEHGHFEARNLVRNVDSEQRVKNCKSISFDCAACCLEYQFLISGESASGKKR